MRHIGTSAEKKQAEHFVHFLDAQQIEATLRPLQETGYVVWVFDEERVTTARRQIARGLSMLHNGVFATPYAGLGYGWRRKQRAVSGEQLSVDGHPAGWPFVFALLLRRLQ